MNTHSQREDTHIPTWKARGTVVFLCTIDKKERYAEGWRATRILMRDDQRGPSLILRDISSSFPLPVHPMTLFSSFDTIVPLFQKQV
ncbi:hypothetical protein TNCV_4600351 [Trichonephila clavipes]|nr:hypothetical protein TNCV_4600351 [Trichonephila clavipes]